MTFKCIKCDKPLVVQTIKGPGAEAIVFGCAVCGYVTGYRILEKNGKQQPKPIWDSLLPQDRGEICIKADLNVRGPTLQKDWAKLSKPTIDKLRPIFGDSDSAQQTSVSSDVQGDVE